MLPAEGGQGGLVSDWLILDGLLRCGVGGTKAQRIQRTIATVSGSGQEVATVCKTVSQLCATPPRSSQATQVLDGPVKLSRRREQEGLQQIQLPDRRSACSLCRFFFSVEISRSSFNTTAAYDTVKHPNM